MLVGYDRSESAQRALEAAAGLIGYGSSLAVASVAQSGESAEAALDEARATLLQRHVTASYHPLCGDTAGQLVDAAQLLGADLVVVGGGTQNGHVLSVGRVIRDVLEQAPCDVLVVR